MYFYLVQTTDISTLLIIDKIYFLVTQNRITIQYGPYFTALKLSLQSIHVHIRQKIPNSLWVFFSFLTNLPHIRLLGSVFYFTVMTLIVKIFFNWFDLRAKSVMEMSSKSFCQVKYFTFRSLYVSFTNLSVSQSFFLIFPNFDLLTSV